MYLYALSFTKQHLIINNIINISLIAILQETGIDEKDTRIIHELWNQAAKLKLNYVSQTSNIRIVKEVSQECKLLSFLFNIYAKKIFHLILEAESHTTKIKINGIPIKNLRYANDMTILIENIQQL